MMSLRRRRGASGRRWLRATSISPAYENYPPGKYAGIVVLRLPDDASATQVVKILETFIRNADWLAALRGRLAIVEVWRVRFRSACFGHIRALAPVACRA
jgi:hypothetical protein